MTVQITLALANPCPACGHIFQFPERPQGKAVAPEVHLTGAASQHVDSDPVPATKTVWPDGDACINTGLNAAPCIMVTHPIIFRMMGQMLGETSPAI
ncbi:hypothetical protein [Aquabacterium sp.]|uniref:hypothetical protein n=1 Tax=Aquabacterium sp. TaxID=1872578 RepID=UPI00248790F4|nr:hypothetical protein [Aquabacterium sp.]MDI1259257.1 hypothetical protein [Aquabacterium sp.]